MKTVKLGDVCEVIAGQSPVGSSYNKKSEGIEFHQGKKLFGENNIRESVIYTVQPSKIAEPGDILMSVRAPVGPVNYTNRRVCIGRGLAAIRAGNEIERSYLYHFLHMNEANINGKEGATFASINKNDIKDIDLPLPPLEEQRRIVARLDAAFEKIDRAIELTEKNIVNSQSIFASAMRKYFENDKNADLMLFADVCKEIFAGGDVPKGQNSKEKTDKFSVPIYANGEKKNGLYGYTNAARVNEPCVTVSARGTIGFTAVRSEPFYPAVRLIVLIPNSEKIHFDYLFFAAKSLTFINTGTSIPQLTVPMIKTYQIPVPTLSRQREIAKALENINVATSNLREKYNRRLQYLLALKQSLLTQVFSQDEVN